MCLKSASVVLALSLALACAQRQISFPNGAPERRPAAPVRGSAGGGVSVACTDLNGRTGQCVAAISCTEHAEVLSRSSRPKSCDLGSGNLGVCCPAPASDTPNKPGSVLLTVEKRVTLPQIEDRQQFGRPDLTNANNVGQGYLDNLLEIQKRLKDSGDYIKVGTPAAGHQSFFRVSPTSLELAYKALAGIETTRDLAKKFGLGPEEAAFGLQDYTAAPQFCPPPSKCPPKTLLYRTADGSCNNIQEPEWGKSNTGMQRILPPSFTDGIWEPRKYSVSGNPLPSGRLISAATIPDFDNPHRYFTALVTQFGQFLDHDITHLGVFKIDAEENVGIMCCRDGLPIIPPPHPACMPIEIPPDDVFYSRFGQRCMEFVRALPAPRPGCTLGYAQPINVNTHLLDSSQVYGSTEEDARELREFKNGRMAVLYTRPRESLPLALREGDECTNITTGVRCFRGGDDRVNEQPGLTLVHLTTLREHNRVAGELQALNPHWDDERLYQEARRILNAELTHITYNEWLPIILGPTYMKNFDLLPRKYGYGIGYDPTINPNVNNEFATAAFRFGHTLLQPIYPLYEPHADRPSQIIQLRNNFNNPAIYANPKTPDNLARGLTLQPMQTFDSSITQEVTTQLFRNEHPFGLDLISLNIQRGRDHGLPTYNDMREACGLGRAKTFQDLLAEVPEPSVLKFKSVYEHPDDIDLFIGGISETSVHDAVLGPTFLCIIGDQYTRLKRGDRFFYELNTGKNSFTEAQLDEIRRASIARLLCDNTDVGEMQPLAFVRPSPNLSFVAQVKINLIAMFAGMTVLVFVGAALLDSAAIAQQPGRYRDQDFLTQKFIRENFPIEVTRGIGGAERYASGDRRDNIFANPYPYRVPKEKGVPVRPSLFRGVAVHDEEPLVPKRPVYPQTREVLSPIDVATRPVIFGKDAHQEEEDSCIGPQDSPGYCVPLVRCPHLFLTSTIGKAIRAGSPDAYCPLGYGGIGVCCPPVRSEEKKPIRMSEVFPVFEDGGLDARLLPKADVDKAVVTGINKADEFGVISRALLESGQVIPPRSPGKANQAFLQANEDAHNLSNIALQQIAIAQELQKSG